MKTAFFGFLLVLAVNANATTYVKVPVADYFSDSEVVARIYVTKAEIVERTYKEERVGCGVKVHAEVIESLKGNIERIEFMYDGGALNVASEYLIFAKRQGTPSITQLSSMNGAHMNREVIRQEACKDVKEDFEVSWLNTSEFVANWNKEKQNYEPWLTPAYNILIPDDAKIKQQRIRIRSLEVNGEIIEKKYWLLGTGIAMPYLYLSYDGAFEWESYKKYVLDSALESENQRKRNNKDPAVSRHEER